MIKAPVMFARLLIAFASLAALGAAPPLALSGYRVAPMIYDLKPSGAGATVLLRVQNDSDKPITIEMVAERRDFDEHGVESRTPADDDFLIFPPQAVVQPRAIQAIRVQYVGPSTLSHSVTYTVTVKQVPVALPTEGTTGVQFLFNFSTLANVVPEGARANVEVVSLIPTPGAVGGYQLRLRNSGTKYANLANARLTLGTGAGARAITPEEWRKVMGSAWLLPGAERIFDLPGSLAPAGSGTASIEIPASAN